MKKRLFIFMSVLTFSTIGCTNGSTKSSEVNDSTVVDTVVVDSVKSDTDTVASDTVDILTTAKYNSIMVNN